MKNYKVFRDIKLTQIPNMAVFLGANGSGKSTLFDVFGFLHDALTDNVRAALIKRGEVSRSFKEDGAKSAWSNFGRSC